MPDFSPADCLTDFEMALLNSLNVVFPPIELTCCLFHLNQNYFRKISELGMRKKYNTNKDFQLTIKSFPFLAFLPVEQVLPTFEELCQKYEVPSAFSLYFETTYIRSFNKATRKIAPPKYPISLWNDRSRVSNDLPKANACEGFNNTLRSSITATHPNIWKFLRSMKEEVCLSETKLLQISLGHQINKKKYQMLAKRVKLQL